MFNKKAKTEDLVALDKSIEQVQIAADKLDPESKEWIDTQKLAKELLQEKMKAEASVNSNRAHFKDWIPVIASLGGILVIVTFEAFGHSMTSKATGFVTKSK